MAVVRHGGRKAAWGASWLLTAVGCATALPGLTGSDVVPVGRSDVAAGAAFRIPVQRLEGVPGEDESLSAGAPTGAAPYGAVRHGVTREVDLGAEILGSTARLSVRGRRSLPSGLRLLGAIEPYGGYLGTGAREGAEATRAFRGGVSLPLVLGLDITSLYEVWLGLRAGLEHVRGRVGPRGERDDLELTGLRTGFLLGLALGFRRLHLLVELAVDHELWWGRRAGRSFERNGIVLNPGVALRLRF